jgi:vang-like
MSQEANSTVLSTASNKRGGGGGGHNERYHEEGEYERKVRKRRARLITSTEESFAHIRRMREDVTGRLRLSL